MSQWTFQRYGGVDQLVLTSAEDLERIDQLDEARWAATSVPTDGLDVDPAFLAFLDSDVNGRVRVEELKAARAWLWTRLASRARVAEGSDTLWLADLAKGQADADVLRSLAERLLGKIEAPARDRITLEQIRSQASVYKAKFPNGDGVVAPAQVEDAELAAFVTEIVAVTGGAPDLSDAVGARAEDVDAWVERVGAFAAWRARAADASEEVLPLGDASAGAVALADALAPKLAQFFAQCDLVAFESGAAARLQATPEELAALDVSDPAAISGWMARAPVARPVADGMLRLDALNPAFAGDVRRLVADVVAPLVGAEGLDALTREAWKQAQARLDAHRAWVAARPAGFADDADVPALVARAAGELPGKVRALAAADLEVASELVAFRDLEKLVLYQQGLLELARNMVSFSALFDPEELAIFQDGVLILDGRRLDLCLRVTNKGAHRPIAETSGIFLVYADLERKAGGGDAKRTIVGAVTAGTRGGIGPGKRGVFYDREGEEWDALVTDVVVQPISVWEAMLAPFTRIRDNVASRVKGLIESKTSEAEGAAQAQADAASSAPPAAAPAGGGMGMQGLLIGGSVAFAALGSTLAFVASTLSSIDVGSLLLTLVVVVGALAALSALLGWIKLRKRDLSALLEAGGWALNGRMRLSTWLGGRFTERPPLPKGAEVRRVEPGNTLAWVVIVLVVLAVAVGVAFWQLPGLAPWLRGERASPFEEPAVEAPAEEAPPAAPAEATAAPTPPSETPSETPAEAAPPA